MADHGQEIGAQALQFPQGCEILQGDDEGLDHSPLGADWRGVQQHGYASPVGDLQQHLLGPDGLPGAQCLGNGESLQVDFRPVGPPNGHDIQQMLRVRVSCSQPVEYPHGLPVERGRGTGAGIEDNDSHGGGVDQRFQAGPRPLLVSVTALVGDDHGGLGGKGDQGLLVLVGELPASLLSRQKENASHLTGVTHRRCQEGDRGTGGHWRVEFGQIQRVEVGRPQGLLNPAEVAEDGLRAGGVPESPGLLGGHPRGVGNLRATVLVQEGDHPVAGLGLSPRGVQYALQDRVEIKALIDAQAGVSQARYPLPEGVNFPFATVFLGQVSTSAEDNSCWTVSGFLLALNVVRSRVRVYGHQQIPHRQYIISADTNATWCNKFVCFAVPRYRTNTFANADSANRCRQPSYG